MKLHLGCGKNYLPGWINVDLFSTVQADVYADITALPFEREAFDLIYASHVLEHVHRHTVVATLGHWRDLLKPGGVLRLAVPDFQAVCEWYNSTGRLDDVMGLLYGGQNHPKNHHFVAFDRKTLIRDLTRAGFATCRDWNWRETDHARFDDYSQARLPHMSDGNGTVWVSLNVEATK